MVILTQNQTRFGQICHIQTITQSLNRFKVGQNVSFFRISALVSKTFSLALTLKHASSHIFGDFGTLESEENLSFDNYYHKTKALSMNGPNDRILERELEIDGIVSYNAKAHPNWYTKGRKWNCGKLTQLSNPYSRL